MWNGIAAYQKLKRLLLSFAVCHRGTVLSISTLVGVMCVFVCVSLCVTYLLADRNIWITCLRVCVCVCVCVSCVCVQEREYCEGTQSADPTSKPGIGG